MSAARTSKWRRWARLAVVPGCAALLALALAVWLVPLPRGLLTPLAGTPTLVDIHGRTLARLSSREAREQQPIPLGEMGRWLPAVTVALEDHRFHAHPGTDFHATVAALWRNARAGRIVSGASTITQQLIKLSSGRHRRSWSAKLYENFAALRLERSWPKDRLLEAYLNRSHYGNRLLGPAAAARAYFGKTPANLTLPEAIYLAGLPQAPSRFNPRSRPAAARAKFQRSVGRLEALGFLPAEQAARIAEPPVVQTPRRVLREAPHFVDAISRRASALPGGRIATTLDLDLQHFAEARLRAHLPKLAHRGVSQGAIVILDARDGAVRAMVGSADYHARRDGQVNGATRFRSCGSTLKPFLYLKAIDDRVLTAATLLPDTPDAVRAEYIDYDPVNYDKRFWGPVRVREALANSLNVPAVVTLSRVGARRTFLALEECGLRFSRHFSDYGAGLILGNAEVRLLDLTGAYTPFATLGLGVEPRLLKAAPVRHRRIASPAAVALVSDILADNHARRKTFSAFSPLAFDDYRIPCKTGTSSGFRDAWTVGVTAEHAIGVWVGNFDGRPMDEIAAIAGAAPLWREIIDHLLERGDTGVAAPAESRGLASHEVCALTGLRPIAASPAAIREWFLRGTEPTENASRHLRVERGETRLFLPPEYALWCASALNHLAAKVERGAELRIVCPAPDAAFVIDPHVPPSQQALRLIAAGNADEELSWTVDGQPVARSSRSWYWPLAEGRHRVEVKSRDARATGEFRVEAR